MRRCRNRPKARDALAPASTAGDPTPWRADIQMTKAIVDIAGRSGFYCGRCGFDATDRSRTKFRSPNGPGMTQ
jgi:hypothetical protein